MAATLTILGPTKNTGNSEIAILDRPLPTHTLHPNLEGCTLHLATCGRL
jgi:hypothetical protein